MLNSTKKAFTLIELLVVIAIIGILATLAVVALQQARSRARDSKRMADIKQVQTALELFFNENNRYPTIDEWESGTIFSSSTGEIFMHSIPSAPYPADGICDSDQNTFYYQVDENNSAYSISFCLGGNISGLSEGLKCATPGGIIDYDCSAEIIEEDPPVYALIYSASTGGTITGNINQNINQGENGLEVIALANIGYSFSQWSDGLTTASRIDLNVQSNIEVTAQFTANTYTLTFNPQSGTVSPVSKSVVYNQEVGTLPAPTRSGYTFLEWNSQSDGSGTTYASSTVYSLGDNSTIYAVWWENLQIGDLYGGGKVAYILKQGDSGFEEGRQKGLIISLTNLPSSTSYISWGCSNVAINTETALGFGKYNTELILSLCPTAPSASFCNSYSVDGYDDWYLPSKDELYKAYLARNTLGGLNYYHWSSSSFNNQEAWRVYYHISSGGLSTVNKVGNFYMRCFRSF